ncbi:MAG: hypothetical protein H7287_13525 [Thermoleophilia bacterium]|nr:hypothetical protein [Thermoleophilia bacterium]
MMRIDHEPDTIFAWIELEPSPHLHSLPVGKHVIAYDDASNVTGIEVLDTREFGEPFDRAAAHRAVTWAREQLTARDVR